MMTHILHKLTHFNNIYYFFFLCALSVVCSQVLWPSFIMVFPSVFFVCRFFLPFHISYVAIPKYYECCCTSIGNIVCPTTFIYNIRSFNDILFFFCAYPLFFFMYPCAWFVSKYLIKYPLSYKELNWAQLFGKRDQNVFIIYVEYDLHPISAAKMVDLLSSRLRYCFLK